MGENDLIAIFVSIIAIGIAAGFSAIGWYYQRKNYRSSMLLKVFNELSTDSAREKREKVYDFFCKYKMKPTKETPYDHADFDRLKEEIEEEKFKEIRKTANSVELSMERVCLLVEEGYIDEEEIKKHYGEMIVKSWKALRYDIEQNQGPNRKGYAVNFERLAKKFRDDSENPIDPKI